MSSIKLLLKENKVNSEGLMPLYLRIIKDRKTKFIALGINLSTDQWDDQNKRVKKHPNSARLNNLIAQKVAEANNIALEMQVKNKFVSTSRLKNAINGTSVISFTDYFKKYLDSLLEDNKIGTYDKVKATFSKFNEYVKHANLNFGEIDVTFLKDYETYLKVKLNNSVNTIHSNIKIFRKLFNDAIRDEIIEPEQNPFIKFKLKTEKTTKEYLTEAELKSIEDLDLDPKTVIFNHRNAYVFAAYTGGIRISDLLQLKWSNFDGSNITIQTQKTKEIVSVKVPNKALEILDIYKPEKEDFSPEMFIFPFLSNDAEYTSVSLFQAISSRTANINSDLKVIAKLTKINKNLSFHSSRHTWATRALRKGMRIEYVSKLMGHSSIKTTQIYAKIVNSELDKAMDIFND